MPTPLNVLLLEDSEDDAGLMLRELKLAGFEPHSRRVETEADFREALDPALDVILADYRLPGWNAMAALDILQISGCGVPFIIVSGVIGEDTAVSAMRLGATDFLLKDRLARLGVAVRQAVEARRRRAEQERTEAARLEERHHTTAALHASEERFRQLAENIRDVFRLTDSAGKEMLYVSPAYEAVWGRTCASLYAAPRSWLDAVVPEDRSRIEQAAFSAEAADGFEEEYRIVRPDGSLRWIRDRASPVRNADGDVYRLAAVAVDITERKLMDERFLRMQRMEAIGTMAGGIAHDLNNILAPMLMAAGLLKQKLTEQRDRDILAMVEHGAQRGASIIGQLLHFGRGSEGARVNVQLRHLLNEMVHVMHETFPRNIEVEQDTPQDLWTTTADPTQLHQLLLNLCVNARDAMPDGGGLILGASNLLVGEREMLRHPEAKAGPYVVLRVADTGQGIPPEVVGRIFDPFFTTKPEGTGTGLGLSTVRGIVKNHEGFVTVASEPGKGTVFEVYLPANPGAAADEASVAHSQSPFGQGELILVVDDEAPIIEAMCQILQNQGYRVLTARNGEEAAGMFIQHRGAVRLLLTDLMMPGMGGLALIRALRVLEPALPIVATSGLAQGDKLAELTALGVTEILPKPFDQALLLKALERGLTAKSR